MMPAAGPRRRGLATITAMPDVPADPVRAAAADWRALLATGDQLDDAALAAALNTALAGCPVPQTVQCVQALRIARRLRAARPVLAEALGRWTDETSLQEQAAWVESESGDADAARTAFAALVQRDPRHAPWVLPYARLLLHAGANTAATRAVTALFADVEQTPAVRDAAVELLADDAGQPQAALDLCLRALAAGSTDERLHVFCGVLASQLGDFDRARQHLEHVLMHDTMRGCEWFAADALAHTQRYADPQHPHRALFRAALQNAQLSPRARASLGFALAKIGDDLGDHAAVVQAARAANQLRSTDAATCAASWSERMQARLRAAPLPPGHQDARPWTPIFIVGVPRSGSTLLASRLARHAEVRDRGELPWLQHLAGQLGEPLLRDPARVAELATIYQRHLLQDDAPARFYLDKQPLNLLYADLILHLWPQARIVCCQRSARDTALSLWLQDFSDRQHAYAFDFDAIGSFMHGCAALTAHWATRYPQAFRIQRYEDFIAAPEASLDALAHWLGLEGQPATAAPADRGIATASLWQARQPIYRHAQGRADAYLPLLPELTRFDP